MRALVLIACLVLLFVGCGRYDYSTRAAEGVQQPVRVDRLTGQTQVLSSNAGWVELKTTPRSSPLPVTGPCTVEEIRRANQPPIEFDRYLPERIKARNRQCRSTASRTR